MTFQIQNGRQAFDAQSCLLGVVRISFSTMDANLSKKFAQIQMKLFHAIKSHQVIN